MTVFPDLNEHPTRPRLQFPPLIDLGIKLLLLIREVANGRSSPADFMPPKAWDMYQTHYSRNEENNTQSLFENSSRCQSHQLPCWPCTVTTTRDGTVLTDATIRRILLALLWSCNKKSCFIAALLNWSHRYGLIWTHTVCFNTKPPLEGNKQLET